MHEILNKAYPEFESAKKIEGRLPHEPFGLKLSHNRVIHFRYGNTCTHYEEADIVISISLVAGFNAQFKPGDMVIPNRFVPMDLHTMVLNSTQKYSVKNYFLEDLQKIVDAQDIMLLGIINNNFTSPNKAKAALQATRFSMEDFNEVIDLHVNDNFSPSLLPKEFSIL